MKSVFLMGCVLVLAGSHGAWATEDFITRDGEDRIVMVPALSFKGIEEFLPEKMNEKLPMKPIKTESERLDDGMLRILKSETLEGSSNGAPANDESAIKKELNKKAFHAHCNMACEVSSTLWNWLDSWRQIDKNDVKKSFDKWVREYQNKLEIMVSSYEGRAMKFAEAYAEKYLNYDVISSNVLSYIDIDMLDIIRDEGASSPLGKRAQKFREYLELLFLEEADGADVAEGIEKSIPQKVVKKKQVSSPVKKQPFTKSSMAQDENWWRKE